MMNLRMTIVLLAGSLFFFSCRKDPVENLSAEESRIYITNRDSTVSLSSYKTFSMAETVVVLEGNNSERQLTPSDQAFLDAFKTAMQSRGYTLVDRSANPDLGVQVSRIIRTNTGVVSVPDYYGYWDPGYWGSSFGPGYGWGAPYWRTAIYQVQEGMLAFDLIDLKNAAGSNNLRIVWNALIRGTGINSASSAASQVEQLFSQSPYLRAS